MTTTSTEMAPPPVQFPKHVWRAYGIDHPLNGGALMDATEAATYIERHFSAQRRVKIINETTLHAKVMDGSAKFTEWVGHLPVPDDRDLAIDRLLAQWFDGTVNVQQHGLLATILRNHVDGVPNGDVLDQLIATGAAQ